VFYIERVLWPGCSPLVALVTNTRGTNVRCDDRGCVVRGWLRTFLLVFAALYALGAISMLVFGRGIALRLIITAVLGGLAYSAWHASLPWVRVDGSGVTVRNGLRRLEFPWTEFRRFTIAPWGTNQAGHVETVEGRLVRCDVLVPSGLLGGRRHVQPLVDQLNVLVDEYRRI